MYADVAARGDHGLVRRGLRRLLPIRKDEGGGRMSRNPSTILKASPTAAIDPTASGCPTPREETEQILLGHGSGGMMSADLMRRVFLPAFDNEVLAAMEDQATVAFPSGRRLAFTTDSYVVRPIFFPGGDIGRLAVNGTVNDLAVGGARPLYLSAAFILEEGLAIADLKRVVRSMREACDESGVAMVTGDTKVVDRGKGDRIFITTSGVGVVPAGRSLSIRNARPGDRILVSGTMGDHGIAILSVREGIEFETVLESDTAPLNGLADVLLEACPDVRCLRDPTRGGLSSALNELAKGSGVGVELEESAIPVRPEVRAACELFGLDPMYVANEGKLIAVVPRETAGRALAAMRSHPLGRDSAVVGEVVSSHRGLVVMTSPFGGQRMVAMIAGEHLPRIC
ncbi:hydrogenase expression/formation protein HypE [Paludisphaera sp. Pla2]|uniref:Hydrogenase expression/formation protein HypE n=2 Tax=Paludisphaera mucosa TaxID=3030827 RepID=A0ABT6FCZ1_9BACT|nr:hydrogenase expression/formation protein HypE [Paludisphaera mucosa]MDG3005442.1 hydrogenase expression/formation protein HypE [Paludisphaera mucosa]